MSTLEAIHIGDVVQLKSGGPSMTVARIDTPSAGEFSVVTMWFCNHQVYSDRFPAEVLVRVKP